MIADNPTPWTLPNSQYGQSSLIGRVFFQTSSSHSMRFVLCPYCSVTQSPFSSAPVKLCRLLDSLIELGHMLLFRPRISLRVAALDLAALLETHCSRLKMEAAAGGRKHHTRELCEPRVLIMLGYFLRRGTSIQCMRPLPHFGMYAVDELANTCSKDTGRCCGSQCFIIHRSEISGLRCRLPHGY